MKKSVKCITSILLAVILMLGGLPIPASAETTYTMKQKRDMIVQTALAYYYHNPYVQYDGVETTANNKLARHSDKGAPEDAAVDSQVYSVCSGYCWKCYEDAFDYQLFGMTNARTRTWVAMETERSATAYNKIKDCVIYQYVGPYGQDTEAHGGKVLHGETDLNKALTESRGLLEPGDIIVYATESGGHAMLFVGDCLGDGKEYILHCWGGSYDTTTYKDKYETEGSIKLQPVDEACYGDKASPNCYLGSAKHSDWGFAILRPFNDPVLQAKVPQPKAVSRIRYPYLEVWRELDRNKFLPAHTGEEIPVTVTITNNGTDPYSDLPVEEILPAGQALVEGSATAGVTISGSTLRWRVNVPAGETVRLTYKVKLLAEMGETVTFPHGKVAEIPTRQTSLTMGGTPLDAAQRSSVSGYGKGRDGKTTSSFQNLDYFNRFYENALGVDIGLPETAEDLWKALCDTKAVAISEADYDFSRWKTGSLTDEQRRLKQMVLPLHLTGRYVDDETIGIWDRVRDHNPVFYEPGDLFLCVTGDAIAADIQTAGKLEFYVYLGNSEMLCYDGTKTSTVKPFADVMDYALKYSLLLALRPGLVQCFDHSAADHTEAVAATCTLKGVQEYWTCPACRKDFSDSLGEHEIADLAAWKTDAGSLPKLAHEYQGGECIHCHEKQDTELKTEFFTSLNLDSAIRLNFYADLPAGYANARLIVDGVSYPGTDGFYPTVSLNAKELTKTVTCVLTAEKDGVTFATKPVVTSVRGYAESLLGKIDWSKEDGEFGAKSGRLMAAMLNYGAEAQKYFGCETDDLANANISGYQQYLSRETPAADLSDGANSLYYGTSCVLGSNMNMKFYWNLKNVQGRENRRYVLSYVNYRNEEKSLELTFGDLTDAGNGYYSYTLTGLVAPDIDTLVTVQIFDGSVEKMRVTDSLSSYIARAQATHPEMAALARAMLQYGRRAKAYFAGT